MVNNTKFNLLFKSKLSLNIFIFVFATILLFIFPIEIYAVNKNETKLDQAFKSKNRNKRDLKMKKQILSFGAHPDDIEIGCGGTEYNFIQKGYEVTHVYVTSGEAGSMEIPKSELGKTREKEALASAKLLGVKEVIFLHCNDGFTSFDEKTRSKVINLIRKIKPEIIFVHGASDKFPDHALVHKLVMSATAGAAGPWFQDTKGKPWKVKHILGYEVWHPINSYQYAVDITKSIDIKMKALSLYKSQVEPTRYDEAFKGMARYRGVMTWVGKYAEVFEVLQTNIE